MVSSLCPFLVYTLDLLSPLPPSSNHCILSIKKPFPYFRFPALPPPYFSFWPLSDSFTETRAPPLPPSPPDLLIFQDDTSFFAPILISPYSDLPLSASHLNVTTPLSVTPCALLIAITILPGDLP